MNSDKNAGRGSGKGHFTVRSTAFRHRANIGIACTVLLTGLLAFYPAPVFAGGGGKTECSPCSALHVDLRVRFIHTHALQIQQEYVLIAGDSITEGLWLDRHNGLPVLNGGIGFGNTKSVANLLGKWPTDARSPSSIVIAIGVNDTVKATREEGYFAKWEASYRDAILAASRLAPNHVIVSTIIPVEPGNPGGEDYYDYFDRGVIESFNDIIRRLARETNSLLVDNDPAFVRLQKARRRYTTDGVHLNSLGYTTWKTNLQEAARK